MDRYVTREDLDELKEDIKALEHKVDELFAAMNRIELEFAKSSAKAIIETAEELARLKIELQQYRGNSNAEIGNVTTRTAIMWGVFGSVAFLVFGALIAIAMQKIFGVKP